MRTKDGTGGDDAYRLDRHCWKLHSKATSDACDELVTNPNTSGRVDLPSSHETASDGRDGRACDEERYEVPHLGDQSAHYNEGGDIDGYQWDHANTRGLGSGPGDCLEVYGYEVSVGYEGPEQEKAEPGRRDHCPLLCHAWRDECLVTHKILVDTKSDQ